MRMDLGGVSVMFTGDAEENAGNYVVKKYENTNGNLKTFETRACTKELGVEKEYKSFLGTQRISLRG